MVIEPAQQEETEQPLQDGGREEHLGGHLHASVLPVILHNNNCEWESAAAVAEVAVFTRASLEKYSPLMSSSFSVQSVMPALS